MKVNWKLLVINQKLWTLLLKIKNILMETTIKYQWINKKYSQNTNRNLINIKVIKAKWRKSKIPWRLLTLNMIIIIINRRILVLQNLKYHNTNKNFKITKMIQIEYPVPLVVVNFCLNLLKNTNVYVKLYFSKKEKYLTQKVKGSQKEFKRKWQSFQNLSNWKKVEEWKKVIKCKKLKVKWILKVKFQSGNCKVCNLEKPWRQQTETPIM
jgi:hypothetical protein